MHHILVIFFHIDQNRPKLIRLQRMIFMKLSSLIHHAARIYQDSKIVKFI